MSTLLHIQVSPMGDNSISLSVAEEFLKGVEGSESRRKHHRAQSRNKPRTRAGWRSDLRGLHSCGQPT